jgi:23S rRNA pseudouridine1911/1915/1917 synthase
VRGQTIQAELLSESLPARPERSGSGGEWPSFVVYHDEDVIVINKPRGLVVHPSPGHWDVSVVSELLPWLYQSEDEPIRPGVVHRLDRDTTGLMVLARNIRSREMLSQAIQTRSVTRQYLAVVRGWVEPLAGVIDAALGRHPTQRLKMAVIYNGRPARTRYRTLARWPGFSLLECTLKTGRTHQIRVHLASLGHPVAGDVLYGGRHPAFPLGQLLHAARLRFLHPVREDVLDFVVLPPADWRGVSTLGTAEVVERRVFKEGSSLMTAELLHQLGAACTVRSS